MYKLLRQMFESTIGNFKVPFLMAVLVIALLIPLITTTGGKAHADTGCAPNGVMSGGSGSSWLNGNGVNVCNNGSSDRDDYGQNCVPVTGAPGDSECSSGYVNSGEEWQCVELVNRLYLTNGWITSRWRGNGNTLIDSLPSGLTDQSNGTISYINPGDAITLDDGGDGHVGVVNSVTTSGGVTTIHIINQNVYGTINTSAYIDSGSFSAGNAHLHMYGWSGFSVQAIVHAPVASPPPGGIPSSSVVAFNSQENVLARGTDNESYINSWGSSWSGFNSMQTSATFAGNPTGIKYGSEDKVYDRGTNNEIYESTWNGSSWGTFGTLESGATFASDPVAIQFNSDTLNLFAVGTDGQMYEISKNPGWGTFSLLQSGAYFEGNPTVIRFNGNEYVVARGINNQMYVDTWTSGSGWSGFSNLDSGATFSSDPAVFVFDGVLNVFATGTDGQMYVNYLDTSWHPFSLIESGAYFSSDPTVAQFGNEEKVFARGTNNEIYENTWDGSSWYGFGSLETGATFSGNPVAINYGGVLNLFALGTDTQMYEISKDPSWGTFGVLDSGAEFNGFSLK